MMAADDIAHPSTAFRAGTLEVVDFNAGRALREPLESWSTGLTELDRVLGGGLHPGEVSVIAALTGRGKSSFVDGMALRISERIATDYFSYEMGYEKTMERLISKMTGWPALTVRGLMAQQFPHIRITEALQSLQFDHTLRIIEPEEGVPMTLDVALSQMVVDNARLAIFDSLDYLDDWSAKAERADYAPRDMLRKLRRIAKEYRMHFVSVHQLKAPSGPVRRPDVGDVADSYHVAKIADTVIILHRPHLEDRENDNVAELLVRKNRNGPTCILHAEWHGPTMTFRDMTPEQEERLTCCRPR